MAVLGMLGGAALIVAVAAFAGAKKRQQWEEFSTAHECKLVEHRKGDVSVTTAVVTSPSSGASVIPVMEVTPDKRAYLCNDGVTYWR